MLERKIYAVDDYPYAAYTTKRTIEKLSRHKCDVVDFESPLVLLNQFQKDYEDVDMVITDYEMPNLRGDALIKELREIKPDIRIVVMSAWLDTSASEGKELIGREVKALNPDLILTKPFPEKWVENIDNILNGVD